MQREVDPNKDLCIQVTLTLADLPDNVDEVMDKLKAMLSEINHDIDIELVGMPLEASK